MRRDYRLKYRSKLKRLRKGKGVAGVSLLSQVMECQSQHEIGELMEVESQSSDSLVTKCRSSDRLGQDVVDQQLTACGGLRDPPENGDSVPQDPPAVECEFSGSMELVSPAKDGVSDSDISLEKDCETDVVSVSSSADARVIISQPKLSFSIDSILYGGQVGEFRSVAEFELGEDSGCASAFKSVNGTSGLSVLRRKSLMYVDVCQFHCSE